MPRFEILDNPLTPLGELCLRRRELLSRPGTLITEVTLDGELLMNSLHTESERALATRALAWHPGPALDVLVGGFGLGYTAREALRDPRVRRLEVVDLLPEVLSWLPRGLIPLSEELQAEPRLGLRQGDIYAELLRPAPTPRWDLILIDVDHDPETPLGPGSESFYRAPGLRAAATHLRPGGVLAVWSSQDDPPFLAALEQVFPRAVREELRWWNDLIDQEERQALFLAAREP